MNTYISALPFHYAPVLLALVFGLTGCGEEDASFVECTTEAECYEMVTVPIPDDVTLEVGGLAILPDGRPAVATRHGEVWLIDGAYETENPDPTFTRFAHGLHEPLGLAWKDGALYTSQRGELTRLEDTDGDEKADRYDTVFEYPITGNYHEYAYGPVILPDGNFFVSLNLAWVGYGASPVKWRGWGLTITPDGEMTPFAAGMRSPAGIAINGEGDIFYAENQGDWIGSGYITHIESGDFGGHPNSLAWAEEPDSPVRLTKGDIPDTGRPRHVVGENLPGFKLPTVWFPHTLMGISTAAILYDDTEGGFGPFAGQLFVSDQGHSKVMRVFLEKVDGEYQGAVFPFREGFMSGTLRAAWGEDHSMFVGMTSRGWASTGPEPYGLQRLVWSGKTPFEIKAIRAQADGFELEFTTPVNTEEAADPSRYSVTGFTYMYHETYGSPIIDSKVNPVRAVSVADDGRTARLVVDGLQAGYIHELKVDTTLHSQAGNPLLHNTAYYTLNRIPGGEPVAAADSTDDSTGGTQPMTSGTGGPTGTKRVTEQPADWTDGPDQTVVIGTLPGLKFDREQFEVEAGSRIKLEFQNTDDMLHNFLVTQPGTLEQVSQAALDLGLAGQEKSFIPDMDAVLYHTNLLQPESSEAIYFTAPSEPGEYPFVCTFPGHQFTMRGVMIVTAPSS